ncbi:nuclear transport factor 2 family protein [Oleomonas cavernae]|nr:nuclear transport factor 2 family protein [Oleomonas cavernae]
MNSKAYAALARYSAVLEQLDAGSVATLYQVMDPRIRFRDPFSEVMGIDRVQLIFAKLFADCSGIRFKVTERFANGSQGIMVWTMSYQLRRWPKRDPWVINGLSQVSFDPVTGLAVQHVDHWDAGQFY